MTRHEQKETSSTLSIQAEHEVGPAHRKTMFTPYLSTNKISSGINAVYRSLGDTFSQLLAYLVLHSFPSNACVLLRSIATLPEMTTLPMLKVRGASIIEKRMMLSEHCILRATEVIFPETSGLASRPRTCREL